MLSNHHAKRSSPPCLIRHLNLAFPHTTHYESVYVSYHDIPMDPIQKKVAELSIVTSGTSMADRGVIHPGIVNIRGKEDKARQIDSLNGGCARRTYELHDGMEKKRNAKSSSEGRICGGGPQQAGQTRVNGASRGPGKQA